MRGEDTRELRRALDLRCGAGRKALRPESWCRGLTPLPAEPPAGALRASTQEAAVGSGGANVQLELRGTHAAQRTLSPERGSDLLRPHNEPSLEQTVSKVLSTLLPLVRARLSLSQRETPPTWTVGRRVSPLRSSRSPGSLSPLSCTLGQLVCLCEPPFSHFSVGLILVVLPVSQDCEGRRKTDTQNYLERVSFKSTSAFSVPALC